MKTFPVKFYYKENENDLQLETIRAEIKFSSEVNIERKYLPWMEESIKNTLTERLHRLIYGDIKDTLLETEYELRTEQHLNLSEIETILFGLRKSIPKITHD